MKIQKAQNSETMLNLERGERRAGEGRKEGRKKLENTYFLISNSLRGGKPLYVMTLSTDSETDSQIQRNRSRDPSVRNNMFNVTWWSSRLF